MPTDTQSGIGLPCACKHRQRCLPPCSVSTISAHITAAWGDLRCCRAGQSATNVAVQLQMSETAHHVRQTGETASGQDSGNLFLAHATAQAKECISGTARWLGKDGPRWWVCGYQLSDDLSESIHLVRKAVYVVVEFVAVAFGPFVAAFRLTQCRAKHRRKMITFHPVIIARLPRWLHHPFDELGYLWGNANVAITSVVPEGAEETVVIVNPSDRQALSLIGDITEASLMQDMIRLWPPTAGSTVRLIGGEL